MDLSDAIINIKPNNDDIDKSAKTLRANLTNIYSTIKEAYIHGHTDALRDAAAMVALDREEAVRKINRVGGVMPPQLKDLYCPYCGWNGIAAVGAMADGGIIYYCPSPGCHKRIIINRG